MKTLFTCIALFLGLKLAGQTRVSIEFGEPTLDCQGRGQLCQLRALPDGQKAAEGEGQLEIRESGTCLILSETMMSWLPQGYLDLERPLNLDAEVLRAIGVKSGEVVIPAGRYALIREADHWLLVF
ncbi:MAG: hypothetical protein GYB31_15215 [Bacteroidetes bacterium]|nr:hypothetical protein [Bacteroidota bacterium]